MLGQGVWGSSCNLLRRLMGLGSAPGEAAKTPPEVGPAFSTGPADARFEPGDATLPPGSPEPAAEAPADVAPTAGPGAPRLEPIACPYCAALIDPPPRTRRCPACRQPVIVRRTDGVAQYLTESSAAVRDAQRRREEDERAWSIARAHWLHLARAVHAPADLCQQVAAMPLSNRAVEAARAVYRTAADQAAREARQAERWAQLCRLRTTEAIELYADLGSPMPPPDEVVAMYREGKAAVLRSLAEHSPVAELAGSSCCPACRADDGALCTIAAELRRPRLPHPGCPRGLCDCDWFVALPAAKPARRRRRRSTAVAPALPDAGDAVESDAVADAVAAPANGAEASPGPVGEPPVT